MRGSILRNIYPILRHFSRVNRKAGSPALLRDRIFISVNDLYPTISVFSILLARHIHAQRGRTVLADDCITIYFDHVIDLRFAAAAFAAASAAASATAGAAGAIILKHSTSGAILRSIRIILETTRKSMFRTDVDQLIFRCNPISTILHIVLFQRDFADRMQTSSISQDRRVDVGTTTHIHDGPVRQAITTVTIQPQIPIDVNFRKVGKQGIKSQITLNIQFTHIDHTGGRIEVNDILGAIWRPFNGKFSTIHQFKCCLEASLYNHLGTGIHI